MNKSIFFLISVGLFLSLIACGDDDLIERINDSFIEGSWQLTDRTEDGASVNLSLCDKQNTLDFNSASAEVIVRTYETTNDGSCAIEYEATVSYFLQEDQMVIGNTVFFIQPFKENNLLELRSQQGTVETVSSYRRK